MRLSREHCSMMGRSLVLGDIRHIEFHLLAQVRPWLKFLELGSGAIGFFECRHP
jgi:hypothetical protein